MNPRRRTAVLVEQFPLLLDALEQAVVQVDLDIVGKAAGFAEALELVSDEQPDLLVGEIYATDAANDGAAFVERAQDARPGLRVVVFSSAGDHRRVEQALAAGASVYLTKTASADELQLAVRQALDQPIYLANAQAVTPVPSTPVGDPPPSLTKRELEILRLVSEGYSNARLARMLWITEQTVKFHLSNIYRKLRVSNRTEASRWAQVHHLLPAGPARDSPSA